MEEYTDQVIEDLEKFIAARRTLLKARAKLDESLAENASDAGKALEPLLKKKHE